jgi:hypothetical protein
MHTETIIAIMLAAAAWLKRPLQGVGTQLLKEAFEAVKACVRNKLAANPEASDALDLALEKPESLIRKALLIEASNAAGLAVDPPLAELADRLWGFLAQTGGPQLSAIRITGQGNSIQVAGRDLITTTKHVQRNAITPDERHLSVEQKEQVQAVLGELAIRLAKPGSPPNFAGAHLILQRRFGVTSYLLLPRERFGEAMSFLKQQRAISRPHFVRSQPRAYRNDRFRAIFAGAHELHWSGPRVYEYAAEVLGLKQPLSSFKVLSIAQLKSLAEAIQRMVAKSRGKSAV